jgi:hypothetical protein
MILSDLRAFDLMPYTEHVETVACFDRRQVRAVGASPHA